MLLVVLVIQGRTIVSFPRFLRFFLCFLSEVEGVFTRFFKILSSFFFVEIPFGTSSFVQTFL